jgi:fructoselysine-6-phosphate deglycase
MEGTMEDLNVYVEVLRNGVAQKEKIEKAVEKIAAKGIKNVFLVGAGGSLSVMSPTKYILETNSILPVYQYNSSEFLAIKPKTFCDQSLVITSSYTGTTKETVAAAEYAKEVGASTIAFVGNLESPLGKLVDYAFANDAVAGVGDSKLVMLYQIAFNVIRLVDGYDKYEEVMNALATMPESLVAIKKSVVDKADFFANNFKDEKFVLAIGSGIGWGETYTYPTCILQEMQWINAEPVHAGEFFHGVFEIVDETTPIIIFKCEDLTRSLVDRVLAFTDKYAKKVELIDTKEFALPGVDESIRGFMSPLVLSAVMAVYSDKLAEIRNHPLKTRKYMFKVEY